MRATREPPPIPRRAQARTLTARQAQLLEELEDLLLEHGFADVTLDSVASELRCSKMTLYTLAPSREQLVLTVVRRFLDEALRRIDVRLDAIDEPPRAVTVWAAAAVEEMRPMSANCFHDIQQFGPTRELYLAFTTALDDRLAGLVQTGTERGHFSSSHAPLVSEMARLVLDELATGGLEHRIGITADNAATQLSEVVLRALDPRPRRAATNRPRLRPVD